MVKLTGNRRGEGRNSVCSFSSVLITLNMCQYISGNKLSPNWFYTGGEVEEIKIKPENRGVAFKIPR